MVQPLRVLYVDSATDHPIPTVLRDAGKIDAFAASDSDDALDSLATVDCVVAVHRPPAFDALGFLEAVHDRRPELPVVIYAPDGDPTDPDEPNADPTDADPTDADPTDGETADGEAALAAGAMDWLPVAPDQESAATITHRIENAVERIDVPPERFEETLERVTDAFFALDTAWRFTYVNDRAEEVLARDRSDLLGEVIWDVFPEAVNSAFEREYEAALETQQPASFEEFYPPLETWFAVRAYPSKTGLSVYFRDVTDRVERERELQQYRTMIETIDDGIYVVDDDTRFTFVNDAFIELTGYDRQELLGTHPSMLVEESLGELSDRVTEEILAGERSVGVVEAEILTADGESVPVETRTSPFPLGNGRVGRVGIVRDVTEQRQFERTLTALHETTRDMVRAETRAAVSERLVETATEVLDLHGVGVYLYDPDRNVLYPETYSGDATFLHGELPTLQPGESITGRAFVTGETFVVDDTDESELLEYNPTTLRSGLFVPLGDHGVLIAGARKVGGFDDRTLKLVNLLAATTEATFDRVARESDLRAHERELQGQADRLERLAHLTEKLRAVERAIVSEETRAGIETAVCEALADTERYEFAWIGEPDTATGTVRPTAWGGDARTYLDAVSLDIDANPSSEPASRTAATGQPTLVADAADRLRSAPWRGEALARGLRSVLSVPIKYNDLTYGVLTVYATEPSGFDDLAADVFVELAETVAFAIDGAETRAALVADRVVELELAVHDADGFLAALAREVDCQVEYEGEVTSTSDGRHVFFTARGGDHDAVVDAASGLPGVESVEVVAGDGDDRLYRATVTTPTLAREFASLGAMARSITAVGDEARVVVELPRTTDVRTFVTAVGERYPGVELLARRERDRPVSTRQGLLAELDDRLTDRQQETLQTAYFGGFFETPRQITAVELGRMLGISQPTATAHLRAAERKLLGLVFGDQPDSTLDT